MPNYGHLSLSCAKIERPSPLEKSSCKVRFFVQNRSRKYRPKVIRTLTSQVSFLPYFNFPHKRPTFAFTSESGYTLGFQRRIAHEGTHGETGASRTGPLSLPSERSTRFGNPAWPGFKTAYFAALGSWPGGALEERRKPSGQRCAYACRCPEASRPRWAA